MFVAEAGLRGNAPSAGLPGLCRPNSITFHGFGVVGMGVDRGKKRWWWGGVYTKSHPESAG